MNTKVTTIVILLILAVPLTALGLVAAAAVLTPSLNEIEGVGVRVGGIGNSGNIITLKSDARKLALYAHRRELAPEVSDELLRTITRAVLDQAVEGDVPSAAFAFELAMLQESARRQAGGEATE